MKTIKFRPHLIQSILEGKKYSTHRLFDDKDLQKGDTVSFINSETREQFAIVELTLVYEKSLGELDGIDFEGNGLPQNTETLIQGFRSYYGDSVDEKTVVKIVQFKLI